MRLASAPTPFRLNKISVITNESSGGWEDMRQNQWPDNEYDDDDDDDDLCDVSV